MMKHPSTNKTLGVTSLAAVTMTLASSLCADVVETKSGARITGTVSAIDGTSVVVSTDYAGDIKIKQSEVVSINTDKPITVKLTGGTVFAGTIKPGTSAGSIQVAGNDGTITTSVDKVASTWAPGGQDPAISALQRSWAYEAAVDVTGKSGNKEQLGTAFAFRATLATDQDKLEFYTGYDRQVSDGAKSADQFKAGIDYSNNFSGKYSWYARDEGGFDRVKDIDLFNVAAAGFGYDFIKKPNQTLTTRGGLAFRYEGYSVGTNNLKSAGLDFGLKHNYNFTFAKMVNTLSYVPTFEDFSNFLLTHETYLELPIAASQWNVRLGLSNVYNSKPTAGFERLDSTYFTRLVLNWK